MPLETGDRPLLPSAQRQAHRRASVLLCHNHHIDLRPVGAEECEIRNGDIGARQIADASRASYHRLGMWLWPRMIRILITGHSHAGLNRANSACPRRVSLAAPQPNALTTTSRRLAYLFSNQSSQFVASAPRHGDRLIANDDSVAVGLHLYLARHSPSFLRTGLRWQESQARSRYRLVVPPCLLHDKTPYLLV